MRIDHRFRSPLLAAALSLAALAIPAASSANVMNGDFAAGLTGWVELGGPSVSDGGGFALFENDGVSGFRALEQTFGLPASGGTLTFDFHFTTEADQQNGDDAFFVGLDVIGGPLLALLVIDDSFGVVPDPDFPAFSITPLDLTITTGATPPIAGAPDLGGTTSSGTLSLELPVGTWGLDATLFFELIDGANSFDTRAAVDDVTLTAATVSVAEPPLLVTLLGGVMVLAVHTRRARRRS